MEEFTLVILGIVEKHEFKNQDAVIDSFLAIPACPDPKEKKAHTLNAQR